MNQSLHIWVDNIQLSPLSTVSLFTVPVSCDQPSLENSKWEIPEINNIYFKWCAILSSMMKYHIIQLCPAQYVNLPFVQHIHTMYTICPLVT